MQRPPYVLEFIDSYLSCARSVELFFRIPVSITLAYAAAESDWGKSALAKKGIVFGERLKQEDATQANSVEVIQLIHGRLAKLFFKKSTPREAFLAHAENLQANPMFEEARRYTDNPEKFLEVIAKGCEAGSEKEKAQKAWTILQENKLKEFDSWISDALIPNHLLKM